MRVNAACHGRPHYVSSVVSDIIPRRLPLVCMLYCLFVWYPALLRAAAGCLNWVGQGSRRETPTSSGTEALGGIQTRLARLSYRCPCLRIRNRGESKCRRAVRSSRACDRDCAGPAPKKKIHNAKNKIQNNIKNKKRSPHPDLRADHLAAPRGLGAGRRGAHASGWGSEASGSARRRIERARLFGSWRCRPTSWIADVTSNIYFLSTLTCNY